MSETLSKTKIDWFTDLPVSRNVSFSGGYTKICPCGAVFSYQPNETTQEYVDGWINAHFGHTGIEKVKKTEFSMNELYDFTKPVRFSKEGFELFLKEYQLKIVVHESTQFVKKYLNAFGNRFVFRRDSRGNAQIVPEHTEVKI